MRLAEVGAGDIVLRVFCQGFGIVTHCLFNAAELAGGKTNVSQHPRVLDVCATKVIQRLAIAAIFASQ